MLQNLIKIRQDLHRIPELAFEEFKTKQYIIEILQQYPVLKIVEFKNSPSVLAVYTKGKGKYKLFRADMDALPIEEKTGVEFCSEHHGLMHACGHDIHMTVLIGLIDKILSENTSQNLLFLFQAAEEGKGGAQSVLGENIIQQYDISTCYALHVNGKLPLNTVSTKSGIFFAIPQEFDVVFNGKAAHAALPEEGKDAIAAGIEFYQRMKESITSLSENQQVIFHIGKMNAGTIRNVVADHCKSEGTHRTLTKEMWSNVNALIETNAQLVSEHNGVGYQVNYLCSYDPVVNSEQLIEVLKTGCKDLGINYITAPVSMTGEDFGFFTTQYAGVLFWLGANDFEHNLHSETFLPDVNCLKTGIELFYYLAITY